jgi:hypothetical protein
MKQVWRDDSLPFKTISRNGSLPPANEDPFLQIVSNARDLPFQIVSCARDPYFQIISNARDPLI